MDKELVMLSSITYAIKGRDILSKFGIKSFVERTPKNAKTVSCGYSLYVPENIEKAILILKENGLNVLGTTDRAVL